MINIGAYNTLKINRKVDFGFYLDDGAKGILLPTRFAPDGTKIGDELSVFIYHDNEGRPIATTQKPKAVVGDIALMTCVSTTPMGAFLDWGIMKDVFVPRSNEITGMQPNHKYLVKLYVDEQTNRVVATEKIDKTLSNDDLTVKELDVVDLVAYRKSDLGFVMIINAKHIGLMHNSEIFKQLNVGDKLTGFVKKIFSDNKIDVVAGKPGYQKVDDETDKILSLLKKNNGFIPYNDKTAPDVIYNVFGMSKKVFKMTTGTLYKQRVIAFENDGIKLL